MGCLQRQTESFEIVSACATYPNSFNKLWPLQGFMRVRLKTSGAFHGVIHARDSRDNACLTYGTGRDTTFLTINLLTPPDHEAYCGVLYNNVSKLCWMVKTVSKYEFQVFPAAPSWLPPSRQSRLSLASSCQHFPPSLPPPHRYSMNVCVDPELWNQFRQFSIIWFPPCF